MLVARSSYASETADEAWDALSRMYTHARPHAASPDARIRFDTAETPSLAVDRGWLHSAGGAFDPSPDQLNIISVLSGRISLDFGRQGAIANTADDSYLYLPDSPAQLEWQGFGALAVRLPVDLVARVVAGTTGLEAGELRFLAPRPLSAAHARLWLHTARATWRDLVTAPEDVIGDLEHQALLNVMISAVVTVFPNTAMTRGYLAGPGDVRPPALRRAVAYIEDHASLPITVTDIAEAAGCSPRALHAAFRRSLDTSPTLYLQRVRLESAHRDLRRAEPSTHEAGPLTASFVAAVAARWGFGPRSGFDRLYRARFGVPPGHTLHTWSDRG